MSWRWSWLPFAGLLIILPYPGTVAARLLLLVLGFVIATTWYLKTAPTERVALPCKLPLVVWWVVGLASLTYALDPIYSVGELKNELGYTLLALFSFFVVGQQRDAALFAQRALGFGMAIMACWSISTWVVNDFLWLESGGHGGVGVVSTYVVTALPVLFWLALEDPHVAGRRAAQSLIACALLVAAISTQRAAWPALAAELAVVTILLARNGRISVSRRLAMGLVIAILVLLPMLVLLITLHRWGNVQNLSDNSRLLFWPSVLSTIADNPFMGVGFGRHAMKIAYPDLIPTYETQLWHAHNLFLNYGLALGLPGALALLALFAAWGRFFWRNAKTTAGIAGCALVVGVVARNQFNDFFVRDMSLLFWALCGLFAGMCLTRRH